MSSVFVHCNKQILAMRNSDLPHSRRPLCEPLRQRPPVQFFAAGCASPPAPLNSRRAPESGRRGALVLRLDDRAHARRRPFRVPRLAGGHQILLADTVVPDVVAPDLVFAALDPGAVEKLGHFIIGVVLDALGFAVGVFVQPSRFCRMRARPSLPPKAVPFWKPYWSSVMTTRSARSTMVPLITRHRPRVSVSSWRRRSTSRLASSCSGLSRSARSASTGWLTKARIRAIAVREFIF
jgi:hypothetical protein